MNKNLLSFKANEMNIKYNEHTAYDTYASFQKIVKTASKNPINKDKKESAHKHSYSKLRDMKRMNEE